MNHRTGEQTIAVRFDTQYGVSTTVLIETSDTLSAYGLVLDLAPHSTKVLPGDASTWKVRVETEEPAEILAVIAEWLDYSGIAFMDVLVDGVSQPVVATRIARLQATTSAKQLTGPC
jgi:hypothetical protein